jgi:hypothetical protein
LLELSYTWVLTSKWNIEFWMPSHEVKLEWIWINQVYLS